MSFATILAWAGVGFFVVFFFGFCIFIHELGHFLAARWRGLHVIAFSIGFKKIWSKKYNGVEYRIGCLPFGGYVDLPQIDASGEPKDENDCPLPPAKPLDRIITAFAGPLFNVLFGFVLGVAIWVWGIPQDSPKMREITVASIKEGSPEYEAGLRKDDKIVSLNGKKFYYTWGEFAREIIFVPGVVSLGVQRGAKRFTVNYHQKVNKDFMPGEEISYPFFHPKIPLTLYPVPGMPAEVAGMKPGDTIIAINGEPVANTDELNDILINNQGNPLSILVRRDGGAELEFKNIIPKMNEETPGVYRIGVSIEVDSKLVNVSRVSKGSPAEAAGILAGDIIETVNGKPIESARLFIDAVAASNGLPQMLHILRNGKPLDLEVTPRYDRNYDAGLSLFFVNHPNPWDQFLSVVSMSYKSLRGVFSRDSTIKARHFSGPIGIVRLMGTAVYRGSVMQGLYIVVIITFSLGMLNLFPIPVLDGGHILLAFVQMILGRPLPARLVQPVTYAFVILLISFMVFVSYYDVLRILPARFHPDVLLNSKNGEDHAAGAASDLQDKKNNPTTPSPTAEPASP